MPLPNVLDTPRLVADDQQRTVWRWDQQEAFGNSVPDENPSALGVFEFDVGFPGQRRDDESGLWYNAQRDGYDAAMGSYTQADPLGITSYRIPVRRLSLLYAYVDADPLRNVDALGLCPCPGGVWDQEFGDFQLNVAAGGYVSVGNVNLICRSNTSLKCSGKQLCIGAGTPNIGVSWALGGVQFGAPDSNDLSGWSGTDVFSGWYLGAQGGVFQGQIGLSGQGGGTAIGLPRGTSASLTKCLNYYMKCNCPTCPPAKDRQ